MKVIIQRFLVHLPGRFRFRAAFAVFSLEVSLGRHLAFMDVSFQSLFGQIGTQRVQKK